MQVSKSPERDRDVFYLLPAIKELSAGQIARATQKKGLGRNGNGISATTIRNWRKDPKQGGTRFQLHYTMSAAANAVGLKYVLADAVTARGLLAKQRAKNGSGS